MVACTYNSSVGEVETRKPMGFTEQSLWLSPRLVRDPDSKNRVESTPKE